jgi:hypothetical protein
MITYVVMVFVSAIIYRVVCNLLGFTKAANKDVYDKDLHKTFYVVGWFAFSLGWFIAVPVSAGVLSVWYIAKWVDKLVKV